MQSETEYIIQAYWGSRREAPAQCGERFWRMLEFLAAVDPLFSDWKFFNGDKFLPMPEASGDELTDLIASCVDRADDGYPVPISGYWFGAGTRTGTKTSLTLTLRVGCYIPDPPFLANTAELLTLPLNDENAKFITFPTFKSALLAIAAAWDATCCAAYPWNLIPLWREAGWDEPALRMAWITYLSPRYAPMVTPPRSAIVEYPPQGGIVMIATKDRFEIANPAHLAVAREIAAAVARVDTMR